MTAELPPILRPGKTEHPIHPLIAGRWSSRAIDPSQDITHEALARVLEAARWSASGMNNQPWAYVVVTRRNETLLKAAQATLFSGNHWARNAPVLLFVLGRRFYRGKYWYIPNRLHKYEVGMATAQMALQAANDGLVFHQLQGFNPLRARRVLRVPARYSMLTAIAVGHPGPLCTVPEAKRPAESALRSRRSTVDFSVFDQFVNGRRDL